MTLEIALTHRAGTLDLAVEITAPEGLTAFFGRSGAGKTTVLRAVAGLLRPDRGRIVLNGRVLTDTAAGTYLAPWRRRIGYVFQESRLLPHLSVRQNLLYGAPGAGRLGEVTELLGIGDLLARRPAGLSGGEAQRVAIGRALLTEPELLLMDEPLASLDQPRRAEILPYLERLRDEARMPILYVSHAVGEVARLATTLVLIEAGRIVRTGPVAEVMADPNAGPVFGVGAAGAILPAEVAAHEPDGLSRLDSVGGPIWLPQVAAPVGARIRIRVRADDVILATERPTGLSALNMLSARVAAIHPGDGPGVLVQLALGDERLLARITKRSAEALGLTEGMAVHAVLKSVAVARDDVGTAA